MWRDSPEACAHAAVSARRPTAVRARQADENTTMDLGARPFGEVRAIHIQNADWRGGRRGVRTPDLLGVNQAL